MNTSQESQKPIPDVILRVQLKRLVEQQSSKGMIYTKELLSLIDQFETSEQVVLLTTLQKQAILPYTMLNPDLEMTPDDIIALLKVCPVSSLDVRQRTSSPLNSFTKKRRPSSVESSVSSSIIIDSTPQDHTDYNKDAHQEIDRYYRRSLQLTQRLKSSERNLAHMTRDNEDRMIQLQNKVEDMSREVIKQRKEIQEYKGKEKNSLEQISALEAHILKIQRSETDQKQVYMSIKLLFDEKCQETQQLQYLLRQKERDLQKTENLLNNFKYEVEVLHQEKNRLISLQNTLELELENSAQAQRQWQEQKNENERLKEIIDALKTDLDEALGHKNEEESLKILKKRTSNLSLKEEEPRKTLENELIYEDERLKSVHDEKEYYKNRANEAIEDLSRVKSELDYLRKALDSENIALLNELAELKQKKISNVIPPLSPSSSDTLSNSIESIIPDKKSKPQNKKLTKKKRTVQDLHTSSGSTNLSNIPTVKNPKKLTKKDDKIVTNTVTFALYTVLVYIFGIITSTFLLDGSAPQYAFLATSVQIPKGKVLETVLYWIGKLLFESEGLPIS